MAHTGDKNDPSRVVEILTVQGRNSWRNVLHGIIAGRQAEAGAEVGPTGDAALNMGPPPGRVMRLWNEQNGGNSFPETNSFPATYDMAHIPHIQIQRAPQRAVPRTWADNDVQIPATFVGAPL